jgi:PAS domain S-box-containing protein
VTPVQSAIAVIESLSDPIFLVDGEGLLAGVNSGASVLIGLPKASVTGMPFGNIVEYDAAEVERKLAGWRRGREAVPGTLLIRTPDGTRKVLCEVAAIAFGIPESPALVLIRCRERLEATHHFTALEDRIQALAREIRERQRTEEALRNSERRFRGIFENASDAILIADDGGMIVEANPAACELVGRPMDELSHLRVMDLSPALSQDEVKDRWQAFVESGTQRGYFTIIRPSGELREAEYSAVRHFIEGRHLSILRDVTEQRRTAAERDRQTAALARSNTELEQFAHIASHDLQEPLRTISSFLQLTERRLGSELDSEAAYYMSTVRGAVHRLQRIILDLLEFSRLGRTEYTQAAVDLDKIVADVRSTLTAAVEDAGASLTIGRLPVVMGDSTQLFQLFLNVISNALKFRSEKPQIEVTAQQHGQEWLILVRDNGPGIEAQYFGRIFEPFRRLHGQDVPGSGIGLAISRRVVENHGGRIWVESEPEVGSTFYIALPMEPAVSQMQGR